MSSIKDLRDFIDYAEKNRKYATETAKGRRAALKLFEGVVNKDENESVDIFIERFDKIYSVVFQKNKQSITAKSLETYKVRVQGLIRDFKRYGSDPAAFSSWDSTRRRTPKVSKKSQDKIDYPTKTINTPIETELIDIHNANSSNYKGKIVSEISDAMFSNEVNKFEVQLRSSFRVSLVLPVDLKKKEANRLKHIIDGMVTEDEQD